MQKSQNKSDFVVNPLTGRLISTNSKTYRMIENNNLLHAQRKKPQSLVYEGSDNLEAMEQRKKIKNINPNCNLKVTQNKIVAINRKIPKTEYRNKIMTAGSNILKKSLRSNSGLNEMTDDQMTEYFKTELYNELMGSNTTQPPKPRKPMQRQRTIDENEYDSQDNDQEPYQDEYEYKISRQ